MKITLKSIYIFVFLLLFALTHAAANTYYITQSGAGNHSGSSLGNAMSVAKFNTLSGDKSGDTYYFSGLITTRVTVFVEGSSSGQVTLDGYQAGDCDPLNSECTSSAKLNQGMWVGNQTAGPDYIIVQDFRMQNGSSTDPCFMFRAYIEGNDDQKHMDHIIIRRNYVYQTRGTLFSYYSGRYVILEGNKFVHFGQGGFDAVQGVNIIEVDYALFTGNEFGHNDSLYPSGCSSPNIVEIHGCNYQLWEYNDVYGSPNYGANLGFKEWGSAGNIVVRFNKIHDSDEIGITWGGGPVELNYFYVYANNIYNNAVTGGSAFDNADYSYWWSNIINNNGRHGFITWGRGQGAPDTVWVINNTFSRNGRLNEPEASRGGLVFTSGSDINVKNNLFYNNRPGGASSMYHQIFADGLFPLLEHNTYYHTSATPTWYYAGGQRSLYTMQATYNREDDAAAEGKEGKIVDPGFTDPDGADNINGTADDDYTLDGNLSNDGEDLSQCFHVNLSGGDSWFETQTGYSTVEACLDDALDPNGTDWTTTPPTVATVKRDTAGWSRGAYAYQGLGKPVVQAPAAPDPVWIIQ